MYSGHRDTARNTRRTTLIKHPFIYCIFFFSLISAHVPSSPSNLTTNCSEEESEEAFITRCLTMSLRNALAYINKEIPLLWCTIKYLLQWAEYILCRFLWWVQLISNGKLYVKYSRYTYSRRDPDIKILPRARKTLIFICMGGKKNPKKTDFQTFSFLRCSLQYCKGGLDSKLPAINISSITISERFFNWLICGGTSQLTAASVPTERRHEG